MELTKILESVDNNILTEDTKKRIEEAFNLAVESKVEDRVDERLQLEVESALIEIDEDHSEKLQNLVAAIDEDHTNKLNQVVESIERDHTSKLKSIIAKYEKELNESANTHMTTLTEQIDRYLDSYVEELVPVDLVRKAAQNTYATKVLGEAKEVLSVNEKFTDKKFRSAIQDGAQQLSSLQEENRKMAKQLDSLKANQFLEAKISALPSDKASFIRQRLNGKGLTFIKENFEFVNKMYESKQRDEKSQLISASRIPTVDRQEGIISTGDEIVTESNDSENNPNMQLYMEGLSKGY